MGDHEGWAQPSGLMPNGLLPSEVGSVTRVLDAERWTMAEERTAELIACIQPNQPSEERRNAVANYVQRLITKCFSCQVFTFGSVPLKTYLPDGDIDLTAFSDNENLKDTWANDVRDVLENEERSENAEFRVKEVQYIQAEVKIIKCLVENIVVDISFNQVGGLCTLCFLEEIDHLINQNHLFKRSIILIKAWCYYESRILGAHHGLISTYALETLVLYIFHVFNNSFAGPLEVLYRFLEFFSNFDWDNFCVSLWGPVPISSLPEMTAEPPRKDRGELLLSKLFLDACSAVYAVFPGGQENQGQPFVSKHFNVIDPLRTNNNLGRSVSKGNFFRIRSAFAFGAKRLARLLECPKESLIAEVNQFFMNTWERHGSGLRPDAPSSSLWHLRPLETALVEESNTSKGDESTKKRSENVVPRPDQEYQAAGNLAFQGSIPQVMSIITQHSQHALRTSNPSIVSRTHSQRNYDNHSSTRDSDQLERSISSSGSTQPDRSQRNLKPDNSVSDQEGLGKFHFARTQSSPELTETSADLLPRARQNRVLETGKDQYSHARLDYGGRRKNMVSEASGNHGTRSSIGDPSSLRHSSSNQSLEAPTDTSSVSNCYHDDSGFATMGEELPSVSEALELHQDMQQEEQDLVNMKASRLHTFNGQVQLPMHMGSPQLPLPLSPVLASMGYGQRNLAGFPSNITFVDPSWGSGVQFPQGFVPSTMTPYFPTASSLSPNPEGIVDSGNEASGVSELNPEDSDHGAWHEHDSGSSRGFDSDNVGVQVLHSDEKHQLKMGGFSNFVPLSRGSSPNASVTRSPQKVAEHRGQVRENHTEASPYQTSRSNDINSNDRNANLRFLPVSQASSSRSKSSSESLRDGSSVRVPKSARDKWGRKPASSTVVTNAYGRAKSGWHFEGTPGHVSPQEDEDSRDWVSLSTASTDVVDRSSGSASRGYQPPGYEYAEQTSGSDSMIPIAPIIVGNSRQRAENSGVVPIAFYPTGPPVPFLTMLPVNVYNFQSDTGNGDSSSSHFDKDEGVDDSRVSASNQNCDSTENLDQSGVHMSVTAQKSTALDISEEPKSDILHSDFASHWQNLQYGRLCQTNRNNGPFGYHSPVMVPPVYLQGHVPWEGPGRPVSANLSFFTQVMNYGSRLVPVAPLQSGPNRPAGVFQRHGDEPPRFRGGTGTYLPNPKVPFRDRQFPSTRNHRGNYNYDRHDHGDREGSWISAKARAMGRSHGRNQAEKPSTRLDRLGSADKRPDRPLDSYRHETLSSHPVQNSSFGTSNSSYGSGSMPYGMYSMPSASSNGVGPSGPGIPSVVMLYPYDQGAAGYASSSSESLEFGSFGPVQLTGVNEVPRPGDGNLGRRVHEQRQGTYRGSSPRSSPDQPSSPHIQRSTSQRNYELKDEDFPPLSFSSEGGNVEEQL
ncbi:uncharacterized protein LOC109822456 isoform X1 [Asparagus officinalis]|uniref:uncharacterized protein LOC109822456 isoform X1 n=1 Tax=Asparagus officinalis TaxID=4686 RepID=UPI00098E206D|nr:uncharacterized protein LOC109822456 isoform X1 [Asparagus officinalis]